MRVFSPSCSTLLRASSTTQLPHNPWASTSVPQRVVVVAAAVSAQPIFFPSRHGQRNLVTPSWPTSERQSLSASRTLSYPAGALYNIIADVDAYSSFLPYCTASRITRWTAPDADGRRWPREAEMRVGWAGYEERVRSRVYCQPGAVLEAIGGEAQKSIPDADLSSLYHKEGEQEEDEHSTTTTTDTSLFTYLFTRWTIRPFPYKPPAQTDNPLDGSAQAPAIEKSDVSLKLDFQLANPVYAAMSKALAPSIASRMIEAFEKRAAELIPPQQQQPTGTQENEKKKSAIEGVVPGGGLEQTP